MCACFISREVSKSAIVRAILITRWYDLADKFILETASRKSDKQSDDNSQNFLRSRLDISKFEEILLFPNLLV